MTEFLNAMVHPLNKPDKTRLADTAMHRACRVGHVPVVRSLMIKRARWDLQGGLNRMTAKEEAGELKRSNPTAHRQLMELMSEPMPPCPHGHRCVIVHVCTYALHICFSGVCVFRLVILLFSFSYIASALSESTCVALDL